MFVETRPSGYCAETKAEHKPGVVTKKKKKVEVNKRKVVT